jgi:TfoX/Sxy family transcriptional regulator of competence genes
MTYDDELARRIRQLAADERGLSERRMFGGLAFLVHGNMAVAASGDGGLLVRLDLRDSERLASADGAAPMTMRGRELTGWLRVGADGVAGDAALARWVGIGLAFARSLPAKG